MNSLPPSADSDIPILKRLIKEEHVKMHWWLTNERRRNFIQTRAKENLEVLRFYYALVVLLVSEGRKPD